MFDCVCFYREWALIIIVHKVQMGQIIRMLLKCTVWITQCPTNPSRQVCSGMWFCLETVGWTLELYYLAIISVNLQIMATRTMPIQIINQIPVTTQEIIMNCHLFLPDRLHPLIVTVTRLQHLLVLLLLGLSFTATQITVSIRTFWVNFWVPSTDLNWLVAKVKIHDH
jgi:hypothetical protein